MSLAHRQSDRCILPRQRVLARRVRDDRDRWSGNEECSPQQADAARIQHGLSCDPDCQRPPGAPAEREVLGYGEHGENRAPQDCKGRASAVRDDAESEQEPDRRQETERVPVPERLGEPILEAGVARSVEPIGKEPGRERVARNETDADERARKDPRTVPAPHDDRHREGQCDVDEHPLHLAQRRGRADRPHGRKCDPRRERPHAERERDAEPSRNFGALGDQQDARRNEERERHPPPGLREVGSFAGVRGCDDRGRGGSHDGGTQRPRYGRLQAVESAGALRKV